MHCDSACQHAVSLGSEKPELLWAAKHAVWSWLFNVVAGLNWDMQYEAFLEKVQRLDLANVAGHDADWFIKDGESHYCYIQYCDLIPSCSSP
jgi:hypothetical protein